MESFELSDDFQFQILRAIATDPSIYVRANSILKPEFFNDLPTHSNKYCIEQLQEVYQKFKHVLNVDLLNQILQNHNIQEIPITPYQNWNLDDSIVFLEKIEKYCKHKACLNAVLKIYDNVKKGESNSALSIMESALMVKLPSDFGTNVFSQAEDLYSELIELHSTQYELRTGWNELDRALSGGFGYGEVNVFSAPAGMGKSLVLANLGLNYAKQGLNVLYFSLELNEVLTKKRIISMLTGFPIRTMKGEESNVIECYQATMDSLGWENCGAFNIIQVANGTSTIELETYINEFELHNNNTVNVIIVDYADLMSPDRKVSRENIHLTEKFIYEELRNLVIKRTKNGKKSTILTASQLGKQTLSVDITEWTQGSLAGSAGKNFTADNVIGIYAPQKYKEEGKLELKMLKTRNSQYNDNIVLSYSIDTLRIDNMNVKESGNKTVDSLVANMEGKMVKDISTVNNINGIIESCQKDY